MTLKNLLILYGLERQKIIMPAIAKRMFLMLAIAFFSYNNAKAQEGQSHENGTEKSSSEDKFDTGEFIFEHVLDAYYWHIATFDEKEVSVPLPVILYSNRPELHGGQRFHVFLSSKFHHGHEDYLGFRISGGDIHKGKIVELDEAGKELGRPVDISVTKTVTGAIISVIVLFIVLFSASRVAKNNRGRAPTGIQNFLEPVIIFVRDEMAKPTIGEKKYKQFLPFLLTMFFFILFNNLMGLIPIFPFGANVTGNIAVTMVLALFTFFVTAIKGNKHYWKEIFNPDVPWWLKFPIPLMPIIELSGVFTKPFVLMVRLFANMLAGHMVVAVFVSLIFIFSSIMGPGAAYVVSPISVFFAVFTLLLDVLVSFIQAYVFTLLSAIYFGMAVAEDH